MASESLRHLRPQINQHHSSCQSKERFHQHKGSRNPFNAVKTVLVTVVPLDLENLWTRFLKRLVTLMFMKQSASWGIWSRKSGGGLDTWLGWICCIPILIPVVVIFVSPVWGGIAEDRVGG
jgi:hypothetical protein